MSNKGQTAIEYMILLAAVVAISLIALNSEIGGLQETGNIYFERTAEGILGPGPECGDKICGPYESVEKCPIDCEEED